MDKRFRANTTNRGQYNYYKSYPFRRHATFTKVANAHLELEYSAVLNCDICGTDK